MRSRQRTFAGVIHICWIAPAPSMSPRRSVSPGATRFEGEIFQPRPRPRAWIAPVPSSAIPPLPFSPVGFSALIERDLAVDKRDRLPRCNPSPGKPCVMRSLSFVVLLLYLMPLVLIDSMMRFWKMTNMTIVGSATTVEAAMM